MKTNTLLFLAAAALACPAAETYVSPAGSDSQGDGSAKSPYRTPARALKAARKAGPAGSVLTFRPGDYYLEETLRLGIADSGLTLRAEKPGTATLHGGTPVTGWVKDGDFYSAPVEGVKEGKRDFRALIVDGKIAPRACYPGGGRRLENLGEFKPRLLPALAGWWERKPTKEELTQMPYRRGDLPANLDVRNAEFRLYHMWSASLLGVASNDTEKCVVHFTSSADWPMGACGRRQYEIYNIREGMTEPGQWHLDRTAGRVVYWPRPGEDVAKLRIVAPAVETILSVQGEWGRKCAEGIRVSGLNFEATTPPLKRAGFGGGALPGAVSAGWVENAVFENLKIRSVGGQGAVLRNFRNSVLRESEIAFTGARGVSIDGEGAELRKSRIHDCGVLFTSSSGLGGSGRGVKIVENVLYNIPYSGMIVGGENHLIEGNLIYRVMQTLHDGAAIYGNISHSVMRGNVVRDVVPNGKGFGASGYYIDEGGVDTIVENNVAEGVPTPVHFHITRGITVRNNMFANDGDVTISFQRSLGGRFESNTVVSAGKVHMRGPNSVVSWKGNRICRPRDVKRPELGYAMDNFEPAKPAPEGPRSPLRARRTAVAPVIDGEVKHGEWPGEWHFIERDAEGRTMGGSPAMVRAAHDGTNLYVVVSVTTFRNNRLTKGHRWGEDDAVEIHFGPGRRIRAYIDGTVEAGEFASSIVASYAGMAKKNRGMGNLQCYAFAFPLAKLGLDAAAKKPIPFNVRVFNGEYRETRSWESIRDGKLTLE